MKKMRNENKKRRGKQEEKEEWSRTERGEVKRKKHKSSPLTHIQRS